jgi:hypothetical protein
VLGGLCFSPSFLKAFKHPEPTLRLFRSPFQTVMCLGTYGHSLRSTPPLAAISLSSSGAFKGLGGSASKASAQSLTRIVSTFSRSNVQKIEATTQITSIKNSARNFVTVYLPQQSSSNATTQVIVHYTLNGESQFKEYSCTRKQIASIRSNLA